MSGFPGMNKAFSAQESESKKQSSSDQQKPKKSNSENQEGWRSPLNPIAPQTHKLNVLAAAANIE